jgi:extracellular factor (EF) 3-hydroxypalmitic acid methyl ester biosynthesis protein
VLSIGCGRLREAQQSSAVRAGRIAEYIAFDQDPETLRELEHSRPSGAITPRLGSVRSLLAQKDVFSSLDFVYAAGLFDYLQPVIATRLVTRMFLMLKPRGRLLVVNFAPESPEIGYMEACMDWWLTYRTEREMESLTSEIPATDIASKRLFRDALGNLIYLEVVRR